ncbi:MAG: alpha/beta fold hydrolase [Deltaproteobacteria bacterium]|nr:alpha/beta fold hydrolase [Deltaproteobacteria bacterium]
MRDQFELFVHEEGAGRPLILLHGGLANHRSVMAYAQPLVARMRVIAPDLRGSGRSVFHGALTWDLLADDIAELARMRGIVRAVVGGASFGAAVATRVALRHPGLVERLVVLAPAFDGVALGEAQRAAMDAMAAAGERALVEGVGALLPLFDRLPAAIRERAKQVVAGYDPASAATSTRFMASGVQPFGPGELARLEMPVIVVPGRDAEHPRAVADVYRAAPHATIVDADDWAAAIRVWLDGD